MAINPADAIRAFNRAASLGSEGMEAREAPQSTFLETLQRKKSVQHIGQAERMLIENAVYYVDPPQRPAIQQKERTPMELFIRKLVYTHLTKRNYSKVLRQIRRLHWEEKEVCCPSGVEFEVVV